MPTHDNDTDVQPRDCDGEFTERATVAASLDIHFRQTVHDLKNLVLGIQLLCESALVDSANGGDIHSTMQVVQATAADAVQLCQGLLTDNTAVFPPIPGERSAVSEGKDIAVVFQKVHRLLGGLVPKEVELRWEVPTVLPPISCEGRDLGRILLNLTKNALDALKDRPGLLTVRTVVVPHGDIESTDSSGEVLLIEVEDTGCGMAAETISQIFEPKFTTKSDGHGLGLNFVREVVDGHNGRIELQSQPGEGTRVRVWFPCQKRRTPVLQRLELSPSNSVPRILLVDDDRTFRKTGQSLLESQGLDVVTSETADEAFQILSQHPDAFSVILLDLFLPGRSGRDAFQLLNDTAPQVPIIVVSGVSPGDVNRELEGVAEYSHLQKPFSGECLFAAVQAVLPREISLEAEN